MAPVVIRCASRRVSWYSVVALRCGGTQDSLDQEI
jgi:hypothetical protein